MCIGHVAFVSAREDDTCYFALFCYILLMFCAPERTLSLIGVALSGPTCTWRTWKIWIQPRLLRPCIRVHLQTLRRTVCHCIFDTKICLTCSNTGYMVLWCTLYTLTFFKFFQLMFPSIKVSCFTLLYHNLLVATVYSKHFWAVFWCSLGRPSWRPVWTPPKCHWINLGSAWHGLVTWSASFDSLTEESWAQEERVKEGLICA